MAGSSAAGNPAPTAGLPLAARQRATLGPEWWEQMGSRATRAGLAVATSTFALAAQVAWAQVDGFHLTLTPIAGVVLLDDVHQLKPCGLMGASGTLRPFPHFEIEATWGVALTEATAEPQVDWRVNKYAAGVVVDILPSRRVSPYLAAGWSQLTLDPGAGETERFNGGEYGGGFEAWVSSRMSIRIDVRDVVIAREASPQANSLEHNLCFSGGLTIAVGGRPRAAHWGSSAERNAAINQELVTKYHSGIDTDQDGVFDEDDRCPDTPRGARVDLRGCSTDEDHDGVFDGLDLCDRTPTDIRVDVHGCPIEIREREIQLLAYGAICLEDVLFDVGRADIRPESFRELNEVGQILVGWPQLQLEIGGHADSQGEEASNIVLSSWRAQAVRAYLLKTFPQVDGARLVAVGYGEGRSRASNHTEIGRAMNRRVTFTVLNREAMRKERLTKRFLARDEQ